MFLRKLNVDELDYILGTEYIDSFPESERKSKERIVELISDGVYEVLGFFESEKIVSFVFISQTEEMVLLDFFAVCGNGKGQGIGSKSLKLLGEKFPTKVVVAELESVDQVCYNMQQRIARKKFYLKNGYSISGVKVSFFETEMNIITTKFLADDVLKKQMKKFYEMLYTRKEIKNNIFFL